jgi:hypothetical protein
MNILTIDYYLNIIKKIDWFVWEDPYTAKLLVDGGYIDISDDVWETTIFNDDIHISCPITQYSEYFKSIEIEGPINLDKLLMSIHNFYNSQLIKDDIKFIKQNNEIDSYQENIIEKVENNKEVKWLDLIGEKEIIENGSIRRHPLSCLGLVRFEGLEYTSPNNYDLVLGS